MASPRLSIIRNLFAAFRLASRPGGPSVGERLSSLPRLVRAVARGEYVGATTGRLLLMVGALAWLVSPLDLLPEAVLGVFGLVDDAVIASWLVTTVVNETEAFIGWERGITATSETVPGDVLR
jgi:uncharacterized membrane protein YkvA (DUF1232 family)